MRVDGDRPLPPFLAGPPDGGLADGVVLLRAVLPGDAEALWQTAVDPESRRWAVAPLPPRPLFDVRVRRAPGAWLTGDAAAMVVCDAVTGEVVGDLTLRVVEPALGVVDVGYSVHPRHRGRGVATRAARLAADWAVALPRVHRVTASASTANAASLRVLERSGFTREGVLRSYLPSVTGDRQDAVLFSRLPSD